MDLSLPDSLGWVAALAAGLLIGIERERSQPDEQSSAGVRSFALAALCGAVAERFGAVALLAVLLAVAALAVVAYVRAGGSDPGITTEIALLLSLLLGALAMRQPALASALAVLAVLLLAAKAPLHGFVHRVLSEQELQHLLLLAAALLVVLPLLPDRGVDWLGGLNLHVLWMLAVLMMLMQGMGHVALRWLGAARGLPLGGLFGGFVSSTATIAAMARLAREQPRHAAAAIAAALWSNLATVLQLAVLAAVVSPGLLGPLLPALALAFAATLGCAGWATLRVVRGGAAAAAAGDATEAKHGQPFSLRAALLFAALVGAVLFLAERAQHAFGGGGVLLATALAGLADAHASSVSALQLHASGALPVATTMACVGAALSSNALSKLVAAAIGGSRRFVLVLALSQLAALGAFWAGVALA